MENAQNFRSPYHAKKIAVNHELGVCVELTHELRDVFYANSISEVQTVLCFAGALYSRTGNAELNEIELIKASRAQLCVPAELE